MGWDRASTLNLQLQTIMQTKYAIINIKWKLPLEVCILLNHKDDQLKLFFQNMYENRCLFLISMITH